MTKEEMTQIAKMVADMMNQNSPQEAPETPETVPDAKDDQVVVEEIKIEEKGSEPQVEVAHIPTFTPEQVEEVLNDIRMKVRTQYKQPWVAAIEILFRNPVAVATINGKRQPLISVDQVNQMISHLKKTGKFWPQVTSTILTQNGERIYINQSYKRDPDNAWKLGSVLKTDDTEKISQ